MVLNWHNSNCMWDIFFFYVINFLFQQYKFIYYQLSFQSFVTVQAFATDSIQHLSIKMKLLHFVIVIWCWFQCRHDNLISSGSGSYSFSLFPLSSSMHFTYIQCPCYSVWTTLVYQVSVTPQFHNSMKKQTYAFLQHTIFLCQVNLILLSFTLHANNLNIL